MLFNSLKYLLFLPIVFALFWRAPQRFRVPILLIASYVFYMSWRPLYVLLILGLTVLNYLCGNRIHQAQGIARRKTYLAAGIVLNLVTLGFFKYAFFLDTSIAACAKPLGVAIPAIPFDIVLPLGISFFAFEFIHYLTDIYRGSKPVESFLGFSLFASFFPTQIAGPIKRFQDFVPQFLAPAKFKMEYIDEGVALILLGLFKKVMLADNLSLFVAGGFGHPDLFSGADLWLFAYAFAFQIYFDFSGYTDVARGSAKLFGYKVPANFNLPYLASSIAEFWHRWHISLSTWLRDYLFIPLGGSRQGRWMNYRNLLITMTLGGLWHGAAMHYVVWGIYHGVFLIAHKQGQKLTEGMAWFRAFMDTKLGHVCSVVITFHIVCVGWVLFRAETIDSGLLILRRMLCLESVPGKSLVHMVLPSINYPLIYPSIYLLLPVLMVAHVAMSYIDRKNLIARAPFVAKAAWCFAMMFVVLAFSPDKSPRFIYFQF